MPKKPRPSKRAKQPEVPARAERPWRIRFHPNVAATDAAVVGHASLALARKVIDKKLKVDPVGYGEPLRKELKGLYKLKSSDVRVAYQIHEDAREVWILMIGNRRDIWEAASQSIVERKGQVAQLRVPPVLADAEVVATRPDLLR